MPQRSVVSWTAMLTAYARSGHLFQARRLFDSMPARNEVTWNVLIGAFASSGDLDFAHQCFDAMPERNVFSWGALFDGYSRSGQFGRARELFDLLPFKDWNIVSLNAMISLYVQNGYMDEARALFDGLPEKDLVSWNAIVAGYAQNGQLHEAKELFLQMPCKSVMSWNAIVAGNAQNGASPEALELFSLMELEGDRPDEVTILAVIFACSHAGRLDEAWHHFASLGERGLPRLRSHYGKNTYLHNLLIQMFVRCGDLEAGEFIFHGRNNRNVFSWNLLIAAYAQSGRPQEARTTFEKMPETDSLEGGAIADDLTFTAILGACIHHGSLREARFFFQSMISDHQIAATIEHYNCVIAALGKAGHTDRALELMGAMPFVPDSTTAKTLLAACGIHGELQLGSRAAAIAAAATGSWNAGDSPASHILVSNMLCLDAGEHG
ncbi:hypothetical protein SELMODRAFT_137234 [Selaginella moellendorffii]|uniref:Pentacotripeptide-repeat region of PRORP domain-containing protein n=1 Tax=Selaginella moellendorffii TaxID=88036 RepID=D8TD76_SELML|nr:hypothetical protein SELMODRAFT_137234 [Selaginella moellendorffii]